MTPDEDHDKRLVQTAEMFADIPRTLAAHDSVAATLDKIVHLAVEHLRVATTPASR